MKFALFLRWAVHQSGALGLLVAVLYLGGWALPVFKRGVVSGRGDWGLSPVDAL